MRTRSSPGSGKSNIFESGSHGGDQSKAGASEAAAMKGEGRKETIRRKIGKDYYTYRLKKKKVCDVRGKSGKCIKFHYEMKYVSCGRMSGKKKKPALLEGLSDSQIARLRAWRKTGRYTNEDMRAQLAEWGFDVSIRTMSRFFQLRSI